MRRFFVVLRKELKEMLTWQTIVPILVVMLIYSFLGKIINQEQKKQSAPQPVAIVDYDHSWLSQSMGGILKKANFTVTTYTDGNVEDIVKKVSAEKGSAVLVIPRGFEAGLKERKPQTVQTYTIMRSFSLLGMTGAVKLDAALTAINQYVGDQYIRSSAGGLDPAIVRNAVTAQPFVTVGGKTAPGNSSEIVNLVMQQTMTIPIVLMLVIILASQMIASSIAGEKENKTLETLLSTPVGRGALVTAKMVAAGLVALLSAAAYMVGMSGYMKGVMGAAGGASPTAAAAVRTLGLTLNLRGYLLLGTSVFAAIMVALSIAVILGAFAEDLKSVNLIITPLMMMVLLPYLLTMFVDVNSAAPVVRWIIYAIPFSHCFLAAQYIFAHNFTPVIAGILYELLWFFVMAAIAARIFSTDRILTMKLNTAGRSRKGSLGLQWDGLGFHLHHRQ